MSAVQERVIQDNNGNFKNAYDDDILLDIYNNENVDENDDNEIARNVFPDNIHVNENTIDLLKKSSKETKHKINWGTAPIVQTKDKDGKEVNIIVPQHVNYENRGIALQEVRFIEYFCIIEVVTKKSINYSKKHNTHNVDNIDNDNNDDDDNDNDGNDDNNNKSYKTKISSTTFPFQKSHPLEKTHIQKIRSLLLTPMLTGSSPPSIPEFNNKDASYSTLDKKQQKKFSVPLCTILRYFLVGHYMMIIP